VARGKVLVPGLVTGLLLTGLLVAGLAGHRGKPAPWTSHARFTIRAEPAGASPGAVRTHTAADSTVPPGIPGNAEIDLGMGLSQHMKLFSATIGADPAEDTNVSQFKLLFPGYHGAGSYPLTSASNADMDVSVRDFRGDTDTWSLAHSARAACSVRVTADIPMKDPTIREITGSVTCHRLYDGNRRTSVTALSARFAVFAEVWCGGRPVQPCRPPPSGTLPGPPND
jgi:hypothetical protein